VHFFDQLEAVKNTLLLNVLIPFKRFLTGLPWIGVVGLLALAGFRLGGWRLALTAAALSALIALTGQWEKAMITVYLCGISVAIACLIGVPVGILAAGRERLWKLGRTRHRHAADAALLRLSDARRHAVSRRRFHRDDRRRRLCRRARIRYTAYGLRRVDPHLIEAGIAAGAPPGNCSPRSG
jgi:glycine betaine/proline transport system permease protein